MTSVRVNTALTSLISFSIFSRPPSSRSMRAMTRFTLSPAWRAASMAERVDPPVVMTSSRMTTLSPAWTAPSMRLFVPCSFVSLRTMKDFTGLPR